MIKLASLRWIFFSLILMILLQNTIAVTPVPIAAHQFKMVWSTKKTSSTNPNSVAFTFPLSATYNSTYTRYLVLAGFQIFLPNFVNFQLVTAGSSPTTHTVSLLPVNIWIGFFQVSVYVLCVNPTASSYLWLLDQNYRLSQISFYNAFGPLTETANFPSPITITKPSDFKVQPFVTWYIADAILVGQVLCNLDAQIYTGPSPPMIQIKFSRTVNFDMLTTQVKFIIVLVNTTRLLYQHAPFYLGSSGIVANLGINAIFKSSTFSGLDGNCLIGIKKLSLGGNYFGGATRKVLFDAKLYPSLSVQTTVRPGDTFSVEFSIACFNFAVPCAPLTYFNPNTISCGPCAITNCTTCAIYIQCQTCNQYSGWVPTAIQCQYCPNIAPGCLQCLNSTYCTSCLNDSYSLQNNSCALCSLAMVGCYQCTNNTYCTSCLNTSYVYNSTSHLCPPCSTVLDYCYQCTNFTVCIACASSYFMNSSVVNGSTITICSPCGVPLPHCGQCTNETVCQACLPSYFLSGNSCFGCDYFLPNCSTCTSSTVCTACVLGYYLSGSTCRQCIADNPLCFQCSSPQVCSTCIVGYYTCFYSASNITCLACTNLANCLMCTDSVTCVQCQPTYLISGSVCLQCKDFLANCLSCDNSTYCTGCVSDYFYPHLGFCIPCSASILYCITCDLNATTNETAICTQCTYPLFLNNQTECQTCGSAIPNCTLCTNDTYCIECVSTSFAYNVTQNSCLPCSQIFQNCSKCTIDMCTQCQPDFVLAGGNQFCICMLGTLVRGICSTVIGCVVPIKYPSGTVGCLMCDNTTFFVTPVYNHCQCLRGTLVGTVCSTIANCISAIIALNGDIKCAFCNVNSGFLGAPINNIECICKSGYVNSNGTYCSQICGDGFLMTNAIACDDGNVVDGDGCSSQCGIEIGYQCSGGNTTSPSVCYYIGSKVTLSLAQITKSKARNQAVFKFDVHPGIDGIGRMSLMSDVHLNCNGNYTVSSISYSSGQLTIKADYFTDMEGIQCSVDMSFERDIVRSPNAKLNFTAKSNNYPLNLTINLANLGKLSFLFTLLAFIVLGVFVLSLTHKMIGAELLVCCQIVFLSNCFYRIPSYFFSTVSQFGLVTGDWAFFYTQENMLLKPPFSSRVQFSPQFLQSTLFIIGGFGFIVFLWILLMIYSKVRQELFNANQTKRKFSKQFNILEFPKKMTKVLYRSFAFPFIAGLFLSLCIAGYIYNLRLQQMQLGHFPAYMNCLAQNFVWIIVGITLAIEVCSHMAFEGNIFINFFGVENAKQWYIPIFLIRTVILTVLIELGITFTFDLILYGIAAVDFIYLFIIVIGRPYEGWLDRIGSTLCVLVECYSIGLPLTADFLEFTDQLMYILMLVLFGLLFGAILIALIRLMFVYKDIFVRVCLKAKKVRKNVQEQLKEQQDDKKMGNPFSILEIKDQYTAKTKLNVKQSKLTSLVTFENIQGQMEQYIQDEEVINIKNRLKQELMRKKMRLKQTFTD